MDQTVVDLLVQIPLAVAYLTFAGFLALGGFRAGNSGLGTRRVLWTISGICLAIHISIALILVHGSHQAAFEATAFKVEKQLGFRFGSGIYANYLYILVSLIDVAIWLSRGGRPRIWLLGMEFLSALMWLSATLGFGSGIWRGAGIILAVLYAKLLFQRPKSSPAL